MARLGDVIEQIRGVSYKPSDLKDTLNDNSVILLRANNIQDGKIVLDDVLYVSKSKVNESQYLRRGDILVCTSSGSKELVGKAAFVDENLPAVFGAFCKVVRPKIECCKYVGHFFQSPYYRNYISAASAGANINNLRNEHIADLHIPLPPLEEQRKIAAVLDKVSDLIAKRRTQLDKLDELVKSRFIEMFGDVTKNEKNWSTRKISEIATLQSGGTPSRQFPKYFEGTIPWITTVALGKNAIGIEDAIEYITEEAIENSATKLIPKNSLLFGIRVGVGKVSENIVPMCINQDIVAIIINDRYKLNMLFLKNLLDMFSGYFNSQKRGATIQGIKSEVLKNISVSLPPIELQNQFADFVKQTDKSKLAIQKNLEKLEILKKSLMQKYFD